MTRRIRRSERGAILIIAMAFMVMLTLLGAMVLRTVRVDVEVAGAERASDDALYIAEAGLQWGRKQLVDDFSETPDWDLVITTAGTLINEPGSPIDGWREIASESYSGGNFRVAVHDDLDEAPNPDDPNDDTNQSILMRSLGCIPRATNDCDPGENGGVRRLLEVVVSD